MEFLLVFIVGLITGILLEALYITGLER